MTSQCVHAFSANSRTSRCLVFVVIRQEEGMGVRVWGSHRTEVKRSEKKLQPNTILTYIKSDVYLSAVTVSHWIKVCCLLYCEMSFFTLKICQNVFGGREMEVWSFHWKMMTIQSSGKEMWRKHLNNRFYCGYLCKRTMATCTKQTCRLSQVDCGLCIASDKAQFSHVHTKTAVSWAFATHFAFG